MAQILDCSAGHLNGVAVRDAGYDGVIRYLRKEGSSSVVPIDTGEHQSLIDAGRSVAYIYQHVQSGGSYGSNSRVTKGRDAGVHDAQWALSQVPAGAQLRAIYGVTVDYDAPSSDFAKIIDYARGWCDVLGVGAVGAYGKDTVLQALKDAGVVTWFWQTAAWSGGRKFSARHLYQKVGYVNVGGIQCDVNDCSGSDWGQEGGGDMPLDATDINNIVYAMKYRVIKSGDFREFGDNRNPGDCLLESARSSVAAAQGVTVLNTKMDSVLTVMSQILNDPDITSAQLQEMINTSIVNAAPSIAAQVAAQTAASLRTDLIELLQEDNSDQAEQVTDMFLQKLVERLTASAHAAVVSQ